MTNRKEVKEFIHLLTEPMTQEDISKYPTIGNVKERLAEILGRPVWTHELAFPEGLISELLGAEPYSSFQSATKKLSERMPTIFVTAKGEPND